MASSNQWMRVLGCNLFRLQQHGILCDASLVSEQGDRVRLHAVLLVAACPQFTFVSTPITINCPGCSRIALQRTVKFLYTGEADLEEWSVSETAEVQHVAKILGLGLLLEQLQNSDQESQLKKDTASYNSNEDTQNDGETTSHENAPFQDEHIGPLNKDVSDDEENIYAIIDTDTVDLDQLDIGQYVAENKYKKVHINIMQKTIDEFDTSAENSIESLTEQSPSTSYIVEEAQDAKIEDTLGSNNDTTSSNADVIEVTPFSNQARLNNTIEHVTMQSTFVNSDSENEKKDVDDRYKDTTQNGISKLSTHVGVSKSRDMLSYLQSMHVKPTYVERGEAIRDSDNTVRYNCRFCKLTFDAKETAEFIDHKKSHNEMLPYQCPLCLKRFKLLSVLEEHRMTHGKKETSTEDEKKMNSPVKVNDTRKCSDSRPARVLPQNSLHNSKQERKKPRKETTKSDSGEKKAKARRDIHTEVDLSKYVGKDEMIRFGEFRCSVCNEIKRGYENFLAHKLRHAGVVPFHCQHCGKGWYRKSDCKRHELKATCKKSGKSQEAELLRTVVSNKTKTLMFIKESEIQRQDSKRWYKCSICDQELVSTETFLAHKFDHAGVRPYVCLKCEKTYTRMSEFKRHIEKNSCSSVTSEMDRLYNKLAEIQNGIFTRENEEGTAEANFDPQETDVNVVDETSHHSQNSAQLQTNIAINDDTGLKGDASSVICGIQSRIQMAFEILETASLETLIINLKNSNSKTYSLESVNDNEEDVFPAKTGPVLKRRSNIYSKHVQKEERYKDKYDKVVYKCSLCNASFSKISLFASHKVKHTKERPLKCAKCPRSFLRKYDLQQHLKRHEYDLLHPCTNCKQEFNSIGKLVTHCLSSDNQCQMPAKLNWQNSVKNSFVHQFQCSSCPLCFGSRQELAIHTVNVHDGKGMELYRCKVCRAVLTTKSGLVLHLKRHVNEKQFSCNVCKKSFLRKSELQAHMVTHTDGDALACPTCGKTFKLRNSHRLHTCIHSETKPFLCRICGKGFTQKGNLRKHEKETHAETQNYSCTVCRKKFYTEGGMRLHFKSYHSGDQSHACNVCHKTLSHIQNLKRHMLIHRDERPFSCRLCTKTFRALSHARRHCISVHNASNEDATVTSTDEQQNVLNYIEPLQSEEKVDPIQNRSFINPHGPQTVQLTLQPNERIPSLQLLPTAPNQTLSFLTSNPSATVFIREDAQNTAPVEDEPVLMLLDNVELSSQLQPQFALDAGSLVPIPQVHTEEVSATPRTSIQDDHVLYFVKYD